MDSTSFFQRPLAITDVETTGLNVRRHEIIEIGLVLVDQQTFAIQDPKVPGSRHGISVRGKNLEVFRSSKICEFLGIEPEPNPHRGINGAMKAYEVLKKLINT